MPLAQFASPWYVQTPIVHRYLENQEWVEDFFNTGRLRLAAFQQFRTHEDEVRRDGTEGKIFMENTFVPPPNSEATPLYFSLSGDQQALLRLTSLDVVYESFLIRAF